MRTFEQLEARLPMTASVGLDGGTLTITGENKVESVEVRQIYVDSFRVLGDVAQRGRYDGVERLEIALGGRADVLEIVGAGIPATLPRGVYAAGGAGADVVQIGGLDMGGPSTGPVAQAILSLDGGGGADEIAVADCTAARLAANMGTGNDALALAGCIFSGPVTGEGGEGQDDLDENNNLFGTPPQFTGFES